MEGTESHEFKTKRINLPLRTLHPLRSPSHYLRLPRAGRYAAHILGYISSWTKEIREARRGRLGSEPSSWEDWNFLVPRDTN